MPSHLNNTWSIRLVCCYLSSGFIFAHPVHGDPPAQPETSPPTAAAQAGITPEEAAATAISDILRLRKQFGNPLKGTLLQDPPASHQNVAGKKSQQPSSTPGTTQDDFVEALNEAREKADPIPTLIGSKIAAGSLPVPHLPPQATRTPLQQALRQSWLLLDQRAAELEDLARYQEADELRELSQKIRLQSRQLASQQDPPGPSKPR